MPVFANGGAISNSYTSTWNGQFARFLDACMQAAVCAANSPLRLTATHLPDLALHQPLDDARAEAAAAAQAEGQRPQRRGRRRIGRTRHWAVLCRRQRSVRLG